MDAPNATAGATRGPSLLGAAPGECGSPAKAEGPAATEPEDAVLVKGAPQGECDPGVKRRCLNDVHP